MVEADHKAIPAQNMQTGISQRYRQGTPHVCISQIHQCDAPCQGYISKEEYRKKVDKLLDFLNGNHKEILKELEEKMMSASQEMNFEDAAQYRDLIQSVKRIGERQKITDQHGEDKDVIAVAQDGEDAVAQVFFIRGGKLIGRDHFI